MSQVSNKTFNISPDEVDLTVSQLQMGLSAAGQCNGNSSAFLPLDSNSPVGPVSNQYNRGDVSSPDAKVLQGCHSEETPVDNSYGNNSTQESFLHGMSLNLNQTFIASPINTPGHFWNANLLPVCHLGVISEEYQDATSRATSPDSAGRDSHLGSSGSSHQGFIENDCCSLSSGEMVVRKNSFCLEDQSMSMVSSLEEASVPLAGSEASFPAEANLRSPATLNIIEKSLERVAGEVSIGLPCLGMTFNQSVLPAEEELSNLSVALPSESEGGLMVTFVCEASPPDLGKDGQFPTVAQQMQEKATPEHGKSLVSALSTVCKSVIQTSTPLQSLGNQAPCVPSFSESPSSPIVESSGRHTIKQKTSLMGKNLAVGLIPSVAKAKKLELKKFPKSDLSGIKSKVVTRHSSNQASASGAQSDNSNQKQSRVIVKNKLPKADQKPLIKISTAKMRSVITASPIPMKAASDTQREEHSEPADAAKAWPTSEVLVKGVEGREPSQNPPTDETTSALCTNGATAAHQDASNEVTVATEEPSGNKTFCLSSPEKSLERSSQKDSKVRPNKGASNKIEVKTGSVLGKAKPTILKTRLRCSFESSSPSPRSVKGKIMSLKVSSGLALPEGDASRNESKPGNVHRSPLNKKTTQAQTASGSIEVTTRSAKKISLVVNSNLKVSLSEIFFVNLHLHISQEKMGFLLYRHSQAICQLLEPHGMKKRREFGNGLLLGGQLGRCLSKLQLPDSGHPTSPPSQGRQPWIARPPVLPTPHHPSRRAAWVRVYFVFLFF